MYQNHRPRGLSPTQMHAFQLVESASEMTDREMIRLGIQTSTLESLRDRGLITKHHQPEGLVWRVADID